MFFICLTSTVENMAQAGRNKAELMEMHMLALQEDAAETALEELYKAGRASVYAYALSILKNTHDAEDVLQDTFIKVYEASAQYVASGNPLPWILTIARNLALMKLRQRKRFSDLPDETWNALVFEGSGLTAEDKMLLEDLLSVITDDERETVILHAVAGLKHREIALLSGKRLPTVLSQYHRALKKIRTHYERSTQNEERRV